MRHEGTKTRILMNAKCRVQNVKVKMKEYKILAYGQASILHFEILLLHCFFVTSRLRDFVAH
jgi:hypothetical protein